MSHDANTIDSRTHEGELNKLGFWIFLTAEFALFGTLFATLLTLQHGGGYGGKLTTDLFELHLILIMTFALLISSYTCGIAIYYMRQEKQNLMMFLDDYHSYPRSCIRRFRNLRIRTLCF